MKKHITFFFLSFLGISIQSCKKCKDLTYYDFVPEMKQYFGMYKPNNWWVYSNQNNTKFDSLYVYDYNEINQKDTKSNCTEFPVREFKLSANYLFSTNDTIRGVFDNNDKCTISTFYIQNNNSGINLKMERNLDIYPQSYNQSVVFLDSLLIGSNIYTDVIYVEGFNTKIYFSSTIGIIQYITNSDTFSITNRFVQ